MCQKVSHTSDCLYLFIHSLSPWGVINGDVFLWRAEKNNATSYPELLRVQKCCSKKSVACIRPTQCCPLVMEYHWSECRRDSVLVLESWMRMPWKYKVPASIIRDYSDAEENVKGARPGNRPAIIKCLLHNLWIKHSELQSIFLRWHLCAKYSLTDRQSREGEKRMT